MAVGNHDFDQGGIKNLLRQSTRHAPSMDLLCSNICKKNSSELAFQPFKIIEKNKVKVAVLGLMGESAWYVTPQEYKNGLTFLDAKQAAQKWVNYLQTHEKPDIFVCLSHSGIERGDRELARLGIFDLIFSGHAHYNDLRDWEFVENDMNNCLGGTLLHPGINTYMINNEIKKRCF